MDPRRAEEELCKSNSIGIRAELHQWLEAALDRMARKSGTQPDGHFPSMAERESAAVSLGKELGEFLLEKNIQGDPVFQESLQQMEKAPCPRCGRRGSRAKDKEGKARTKEVTHKTRVGDVPLLVPLFRCWKCRRLFSPLERIPTRAESELQR